MSLTKKLLKEGKGVYRLAPTWVQSFLQTCKENKASS